MSEEKRVELIDKFSWSVEAKQTVAQATKEYGPLDFIVEMVPSNIFQSFTNASMLQIIVFALLLGIAIVATWPKAEPVKKMLNSLNDIILKLVEIIMKFAPIGVFALMSSVVVDFATGDTRAEKIQSSIDLFAALGQYALVVILWLVCMAFIVYPLMLKISTGYPIQDFFRKIFSVQMLAFSTSSSAATLPHTMKTAREKLGVGESVASFVLPTWATINMDGTSLYQAVAAVFIAQAFWFDLTMGQQMTIVATATLASIGSAAVPGAGIVMLLVVLEQINPELVPGAALIIWVDRILDMCRTVVNVTGDTAVSMIVAESEWELECEHKGIIEWVSGFLPKKKV